MAPFVLDRGEQSVSHPSCFTSRERVPITCLVEDWVGLRANLDALHKIKIVSSWLDMKPQFVRFAVSTALMLTNLVL